MDSEFFLKSKTILGIFITLIPAISSTFGIHIGEDETSMISEISDLFIQLAGASLAFYGRKTAYKSIRFKPLKKAGI